MFRHHVCSVDQRRSDGGFVLQRLAQEGVVRFTLSTVAESCRELRVVVLVRVVGHDRDGRDA